MSDDITAKIAAFLQERGEPVAAAELAERFLRMAGGNPRTTDLIAALLSRQPFVQVRDGFWTVVQSRLSAPSFILAKLFPERSSGHQMDRIHMTTLSDGACARDVVFHFDADPAHLSRTLNAIIDYIGTLPILFDGFGNQRSQFAWLLSQGGGADSHGPLFSLARIARKLFPSRSLASSDELSALLLGTYQTGSPAAEFENYKSQTLAVFDLLRDLQLMTPASLRQFVASAHYAPDFSRFAFTIEDVMAITDSPGVYIMRDEKGDVIYVGKAKNLRRRLRSYFHAIDVADDKLQTIWQQLHTLSVKRTGSELEALLLEYELIQAHAPLINRQFDVHPRRPHIGGHDRILLLRAVDENGVQVLLLNPAGRLKMRQIDRSAADVEDLRADIADVFQHPAPDPQQAAKVAIVMSWLAQNDEQVSSIDLRTVSSVAEIMRLVRAHVIHFDPHARLVVY
ncbi:nucleotide excision repair endonuclease [candidate division KSB1 bacterium]|nr:nucleotide excision repair endonuclease [candidate division KSB1 bacterium]